MKKWMVFFLLQAAVVGCSNRQGDNTRYSLEQIKAMQIDSTKVLQVELDSLIEIDLNHYLKRRTFDFGSLVNEIDIIPLETSSESLVANVTKVIVSDSNVFIMDRLNDYGIIIFTRDGRFVKRISNGRGPGELSRLYDIAYDQEREELIAYQHSYLVYYSVSGDYLRQVKLPFGFLNFTIVPNGYVFKALDGQSNPHLGEIGEYSMLVCDKDFRLKAVGVKGIPMGKVLTHRDYLNNRDAGQVMITHSYLDTIYQFDNASSRLRARYVLDYSSKKMPDRFLKFDSFRDFNTAIKENDFYFFLGKYLETDSHNVFFLHNYYQGVGLVVYRSKKTGVLIGGTDAGYDTNEIPPCAFPFGVSQNSFISIVYPGVNGMSLPNSTMLSDEDKHQISLIGETDNPALVLFKLKDF